ncbi:MAG: lysophospholipid acyltransferase family protein [Gammaproteobacteria bacterium]|nr:lysophospholipid acyltransferase family protein [Gammaproteobacteria bacterium]
MFRANSVKQFRRNYREPVIRYAFAIFSRLPLRVVHAVGAVVGWVLWIANGEMRQVTLKNLELCFPNLSVRERRLLARKSLIETGKTMFEVPLLWKGTPAGFEARIKKVHGRQIIDEALASGNGVLVMTPHLGAWEVAGLYMSTLTEMVTMYKPSHIEGVDDLIQAGRTQFGATLAPTDVSGVRQIFQALKRGTMVGMLPDQDPGKNGGEFVPFFGIDANTMSMTNRILHKSGARAVFCFAKRLPRAQGYEIFIYRADEELNDSDAKLALTAMNKCLEEMIQSCPEQYQWSYRRFKTRPEGQQSFY